MAVTVVTPTVLVLDTASATLADSTGTVATTPATGWTIDVGGYKSDKILLKFLADATGDSVYINYGDNPPAARAGLGKITVTLAASEVKYIVCETARVMQSDGLITAYCADAGTMAWCFIMPLSV